MRPIKFRAWDEDSNFMEYFEDFREWSCLEDAEHFYDKAGDGLIWMQYTGLKDKTGKEIFEGDIIRVQHINYMDTEKEYLDEEFIAQVIYLPFQAFFGLMTEESRLTSYPEPCMFNHRSAKYEVIGNIYQNPELLEK